MIWLTGAGGMLGKQLAIELERASVPFKGTDMELDITNRREVGDFVQRYRPRWIINCAAYTAVDRAESDVEAAMRVNGEGPGILGEAAETVEAVVVHFSTDYVFDGRKRGPYVEEDEPNPLSVYGRSKLEGERRLAAATGRHIILRISWLYGAHGRNFVETMIRLFRERDRIRVVHDQVGAPTWAGLLAQNIVRLVTSRPQRFGVFHYQDAGGPVSWFEFAQAILDEAGNRNMVRNGVILEPVRTVDYPTSAPRPANSLMDTGKVGNELAFRIRDWRANLKLYVKERELAGGVANG